MIYPAVDKVLAGEPAINLEDNVIDVSTADGFAQGVILYDQPDVVEQFKHLGVKPPKVPPPIAYLEMIEVKESKQGRGHGGKLLEAFMREAAKHADRIFLHATPSGGPYGKPELLQAAKDLIGFYKMHGFKVLREGGSDAIMWRELPGFPTVESVLAGYVAPDSNLTSEPHFLYHGTTVDRLADIKESGVVVHGPSWGTAQDTWPDGSTEPRSYWSSRADMVWHFVPEHGQPAVIRTPRTEHFKREIGSDFYIGETVPVSRLQVLTDAGWGPLAESSPGSQSILVNSLW